MRHICGNNSALHQKVRKTGAPEPMHMFGSPTRNISPLLVRLLPIALTYTHYPINKSARVVVICSQIVAHGLNANAHV